MKNRKQRKMLFIGILLMAIGFAAVTTTLVLNGAINLMGDTSFDGDVVFISAKTEETGSATISNDGKSITYTSKELSKVDDASTLNFEIANKNRQYDAVATINCNTTVSELDEYVRIEPNATEYSIEAGGTTSGNITSTLIKAYAGEDVEVAFTCNIVATASERETIGEEYKDKRVSNVLASEAVLDNKIDFSKISSDTNGKGLYLLESTKDEEHPIYYYRGQVNNNNMKFANFCWKVVRTTETGGTKLIYNGVPDENGYCTNTTGEGTQINRSKFNSNDYSPAYNGYMYGTVYRYSAKATSSVGAIKYGNSFTYDEITKQYTLEDTIDIENSPHTKINNNHYTCWNAEGMCTTISYVYYTESLYAWYINIKNGKSVEDALAEMQENKTDSEIKKAVDGWYEENMLEYTKYLEDTIWCNDRSMNEEGTDESWINNGWKPNGGSTGNYLYYSAYLRTFKNYKPSVGCKNKNDAFTVANESGNKSLKYPVGLLTSDEIMLAGGQDDNNSTYYLYTGQSWWSLSPSYFSGGLAYGFDVNSDSHLNYGPVYYFLGVRPSVTLAAGIKIQEGDGTAENPYTIVEN